MLSVVQNKAKETWSEKVGRIGADINPWEDWILKQLSLERWGGKTPSTWRRFERSEWTLLGFTGDGINVRLQRLMRKMCEISPHEGVETRTESVFFREIDQNSPMRDMTLARGGEMVSKPSKVSKVEWEIRRSWLSRRELTGSSCGMGLSGGSYMGRQKPKSLLSLSNPSLWLIKVWHLTAIRLVHRA